MKTAAFSLGLSAVSVALAGHAEGVSLLQIEAHRHAVHTQTLPEPKKISSATGRVDFVTQEQDFQCDGGKGKWVWTQSTPSARSYFTVDLMQNTSNIGSVTCREDARYPQFDNQLCEIFPVRPAKTYTEHGPVKNEKDCYARARIDAQCASWAKDTQYLRAGKWVGVWYRPEGFYASGRTYGENTFTDCMCAMAEGTYTNESPGYMEAGNYDFKQSVNGVMEKTGYWFCQLRASDVEGVDENTPTDLSAPKEKKTKEQRDACKAAKTAARASKSTMRESRAALKAARDALRDLRNKFKADKADFGTKTDAVAAAC